MTSIKKDSIKKPKLALDQLNAKIVDMLNRHSPMDLTFSKVSRWTSVPRSTLYYYYGNSREKMIQASVIAAVTDFLGLQSRRPITDFNDWISYQSYLLEKAARLIERYPWAPELYFRFRTDPNYIGQAVRDIEEKYFMERFQGWEYFHPNEKPEWEAMRMVAVLKLGMLYIFQIDSDLWAGETHVKKRGKMIEEMTKFLHQMLKTKFVD